MKVEYFFDFSCPYAYLASAQLQRLQRAGAELEYCPMLLGGVFRSIGAGDGPMAALSSAKATHNGRDIQRWAAYRKIPVHFPASHPMRTVRALRALLSLPKAHWPAFIREVFAGYWVLGQDIRSREGIDAAAERAGLSADMREMAERANDDPQAKQALRDRTEHAVSRGVFGAPTFFVHIDGAPPIMLFGQDRVEMVCALLAGWRPGETPPPAQDSVPSVDSQTLDFYFDFSSPFAYLAATQVERLAAEAGVHVRWRPMLLGALFKAIGQDMVPLLGMPSSKQRYMATELQLWSNYLQVPFTWSSRFPVNTVKALRLALQAGEHIGTLSRAFFAELWERDGDLNDDATLLRIMNAHGLDGERLLAQCSDPKVKQMLRETTDEAQSRGVFGAPTVIDQRGELYWGQDRLELAFRSLGQDTCS